MNSAGIDPKYITSNMTTYNKSNGPVIADGKKDMSSKDMFLKLMIEQLKNQDPMNPTDQKEMMSQLASFNTVEQLISLNENFESFSTQSAIMNSAPMLGKYCEGVDAKNNIITGICSSIENVSGAVTLKVGNGLLLPSQLTLVSATPPVME